MEGTPPFGVDEDSLVLLHRVARGEITPPTRAGDLTPVLLAMLEPSPARRPTMPQARDMLARVVAGPGGNPTAVLSAPLPRSEGGMPIWGGRPAPRGRRDPTGVSARTETGLPAARVRPATAHAPNPEPAPTTPTPDAGTAQAAPASPAGTTGRPTPPLTSRLLPGATTPPDSADRTVPLRATLIGLGVLVLLAVLLLLVFL